MSILPADAPLRIYADGLRNNYDLVLRENGQIYTVDNGSNGGLGGNPVDVNGNPTEALGAGEATNLPNNGGTGDPEPLFLIEDGGYYGHPAPARANQNLAWTVYDDNGLPDTSLTSNTVREHPILANRLSSNLPVKISTA
jgi:glucose/arabinose dehydrogenase